MPNTNQTKPCMTGPEVKVIIQLENNNNSAVKTLKIIQLLEDSAEK